MQITPSQIDEIWTSVSAYLKEGVKLDCAVDFIKTLYDFDVDTKVLRAAGEYDEKLQQAIDTVLEESDDDDEGYVDHEDYFDI